MSAVHHEPTPSRINDAKPSQSIIQNGKATAPFALLIIDPQVDFHEGGSLAIAGADEDAQRIKSFIETNIDQITNIYVTLDSHQQLDTTGKFQHTIWPEHCVISTRGHCIVDPVLEGIHAWTAKTRKPIHYHWKGINALTEMYSVFQAEIPVPGSLETEMNDDLVKQLVAEPRVLICGQALSHCVNFSVRDLMLAWPCERIGDLGLLLGMSSPVQGFEDDAERFVAFMRESGAQVVGKE
ncbi:hypothetical protein NSK_000525 [Nannochloropsis salina CCMP1776]|uniref:Uncharacterized protein n=1 Tax=Nannochloropsis salina CCMP1776 TaxID=1027361 RepID=A0A4D9DDI7_9STRA|nr:hypothetical protein NSK_000525 [Nannochloropsis salina CCMP1776]|eukprot:TFJ88173.1 hypothetical protein NSK_000525 [Nannochloropsis salina CCMP1776]